MERNAYLNAKFGNSAAAVHSRIAAVGLLGYSGIEFWFDAIFQNTRHTGALELTGAAGPDNAELSEAVHRAYLSRDVISAGPRSLPPLPRLSAGPT